MTDLYKAKSVILITGASQHLGREFGKFFASKLAPSSLLILASRSKERLAASTAEDGLSGNSGKNKNAPTVKLVEWDFTKPNTELYKKDIVEACKDAGASPSDYTNAIIIHNAASLGDMGSKVSQMNNVAKIQEMLNVNVVSMLALNSTFLDVFKQASRRTVVNMTAPSAVNARPCFGYTSMVKSSRQLLLTILAKEEAANGVRVLHFDPVLVDTASLREIRDKAYDSTIRDWIKGFYDQQQILTKEAVADALGKLLSEDKFESGAVIDATTQL